MKGFKRITAGVFAILICALAPSALRPLTARAAPANYRLPFVGKSIITSGPGCSPAHGGAGYERSREAIDFAMPEGTPVFAPEAGEIIYAQWNTEGFGNLIKIRHDDGNISYFTGHLSSIVQTSGRVSLGQKISRTPAPLAIHLARTCISKFATAPAIPC